MQYCADPYPDELVFSVWARSADHLQFANRQTYFRAFGEGKIVKPIVDLSSHIDRFIATFPDPHAFSASELISQHTLYPYYCPFLFPEQALRLFAGMRGERAKGLFWQLHLQSSSVPRRVWFRYCPACVEQDRATYGECYWHRLHQIHGVVICPVHHVYLESCPEDITRQAEQAYIPAERLVVAHPGRSTAATRIEQTLERVARNIAYFLDHPQMPIDTLQRYRELLARQNFLWSDGTVRLIDLLEAFERVFPPAVLDLIRCPIDPRLPASKTWLARLLQRKRGNHHPLHHVLFISFFHEEMAAFFRTDLPTCVAPLPPPHTACRQRTTCQQKQRRPLRGPPRKMIDWEQRDRELMQVIHQTVAALRDNPDKIRRITVAQITRAFPLWRWMATKNRQHFAGARALLAEVLESQEAFIIRKIGWLLPQYEVQQQCPTLRGFLKVTRAYPYLENPVVKAAVNQALERLMQLFPGKGLTLIS